MAQISHYKTFCFLRSVSVRYVMYLFTDIQKQQNMLKFTNFTLNNSRFNKIKSAKFSEYCFYMKIEGNFQICNGVPLIYHETCFTNLSLEDIYVPVVSTVKIISEPPKIRLLISDF